MLLQVLRAHMVQHCWAEVWLAPFVLRPLSTLSVFGMMHLSTGESCLSFPPAVPAGVGLAEGLGWWHRTVTAVWPCGMATGWQQNIPGGWAARALQLGCLLAGQSRAPSWVSPWHRSRDWPGPSCPAALPAHSHGMHCSPQAAICSTSGSSFSKAHRVCALPVGTLPASVLPQGASFHPRLPAWGR